jgi:hypothetical protein
MIPVLSIHQPYASLIFAPAHCGECGGSGLTDDRDSDGYPRPAQCVCQHPQHPRVKRWETRSWPCPAKYVGRRIAIAATAKRPKDYWHHVDRDPQFPETLAPFYDLGVYVDIDESSDGEWWRYRWAGPLGCIVGTVVVARSLPIARCAANGEHRAALQRRALTDHQGPGATRHLSSDTGPEHVCCPVGGGLLHHLPLSTDTPTEWDISDQQPYGHWKPGGWAWELTDPQPTTERCPWWDGMVNLGPHCPVCNGKGRCDPIPVKGRQGIWQWDGTRRPT